jgi:hypothetical protein
MGPGALTIAAAVEVVQPQMGWMESIVAGAISWLLHLPHMAPILAALMLLQIAALAIKPIMTCLNQIVKITPTAYDDNLLDQFQKSKAYTIAAYLLDWVLRIKLPAKK